MGCSQSHNSLSNVPRSPIVQNRVTEPALLGPQRNPLATLKVSPLAEPTPRKRSNKSFVSDMGNRSTRPLSSVSFAAELPDSAGNVGSKAPEGDGEPLALRRLSQPNTNTVERPERSHDSSPNSYSPFFFRANRAPSFLIHRSPAPQRKKSVFFNMLSGGGGGSNIASLSGDDRRSAKRHKQRGGVKEKMDMRQMKNASTRRQQDLAAKLTLTARANMLPATFDDSQLAVLLREAIEYSIIWLDFSDICCMNYLVKVIKFIEKHFILVVDLQSSGVQRMKS